MVLVLEDDDSTREVLGEYLTSLGLKNHLVKTCEEAIGFMKTHSPVTLLADLYIGSMDSREAINYCRFHHHNCKVILATAANGKVAKTVAEQLKVDHLLLKPFDIDELTQLLR